MDDIPLPPSRDPSSLVTEGEEEHEDSMRSGMDLINYFVDQEPIQTDLGRGVAYLQKIGTCGTSVYEHVRQIIKKIVETRPDNVIDFFEEFSRQIRLDDYYQRPESFFEPWVSGRSLQYAKLQLSNFNRFLSKDVGVGDPEEAFEEAEASSEEKTNYEELLNHLLPHIGLGFPKKSTMAFILAMRMLQKDHALENVRFWGKIYGLKQNYFVAEATLTAEERERRLMEMTEDENGEGSVMNVVDMELPHSVKSLNFPGETEEEQGEFHFPYKMPPLPVAKFKKPVDIEPEEPGTGLNKMTYLICNELGQDWTELPDVTPAQIIAARQFPCYLTGDMDAPIVSYPTFPGKEVNYLRAQIARISSCCHISPQGLYILNEDEDVSDDADPVITEYMIDEEFEGQSLMNLLESSMEYWSHHHNEILPQGRITWWNPKDAMGEEEKEEEEEEEEEEKEEIEEEPEVGKQLLTSVAEDVFDDQLEAWNVKSSSDIDDRRAFAVASSNVWPGAYAFARDTRSENIYFGWAQKFQLRGNFTPLQVPQYQHQYPYDLMEQLDPTPEQEEDYRQSKEKLEEQEMGEERKEDQEEEEEED